MIHWIAAAIIGIVVGWLAYGRARTPLAPANIALAALRALAVTIVAALVLGAPLAPPKPAPPILAVDASASWQRGADSAQVADAMRNRARALVQEHGVDQVILFGDSLSEGDLALIDDVAPGARRSMLRPVVDRAAALGRPLLVLTDGELSDAEAFTDAPAGSRAIVDTTREAEDLALVDLMLPGAAPAGDTLDVELVLAAGPSGAARSELQLLIDGRQAAGGSVAAMEPFATTRIGMRLPLPRSTQMLLVQAVRTGTADAEATNDTIGTIVEISDRPPVAFVSTAPDIDVREAIRVLRGALDLPVRAYLRIAPQLWREEGSLAPIAEADVRSRAQRAGLVVLHGDTSWASLNVNARGARALWSPAPPPPQARAGEIARIPEWYPSGAPASPLAAPLAGIPWDSLSPITFATPARGEFTILEARLGRAGEPAAVIAGRQSGGTRTVVVTGSGYAGWAVGGGRPAEAFTALWGAIFDWLSAARGDERAARPRVAQVREGEPVRWRRGGVDSVVQVFVRRRGSSTTGDSLTLSFASGALEVQSAPMEKGVYEVQSPGGSSAFVVNPSREFIPVQPALGANARVPGVVTTDAPELADRGWPFILALLLLCAEWIGRRFAGLR